MLSKEEIEKTKEILNDSIEYGTFGRSCRNNRNKLDTKAYKALEIAMRYIEQLEQEKADRINVDSYENSYIAKLESREQKLIEKLEERIKAVDKCYNELLTDVGGIKIINITGLTKKEKGEIINKRNCLLVQKYCYEEILSIVKGEKK